MGCRTRRGRQRIPKDAILKEVERLGGYQPVFTPRLGAQGIARRR